MMPVTTSATRLIRREKCDVQNVKEQRKSEKDIRRFIKLAETKREENAKR